MEILNKDHSEYRRRRNFGPPTFNIDKSGRARFSQALAETLKLDPEEIQYIHYGIDGKALYFFINGESKGIRINVLTRPKQDPRYYATNTAILLLIMKKIPAFAIGKSYLVRKAYVQGNGTIMWEIQLYKKSPTKTK